MAQSQHLINSSERLITLDRRSAHPSPGSSCRGMSCRLCPADYLATAFPFSMDSSYSKALHCCAWGASWRFGCDADSSCFSSFSAQKAPRFSLTKIRNWKLEIESKLHIILSISFNSIDFCASFINHLARWGKAGGTWHCCWYWRWDRGTSKTEKFENGVLFCKPDEPSSSLGFRNASISYFNTTARQPFFVHTLVKIKLYLVPWETLTKGFH